VEINKKDIDKIKLLKKILDKKEMNDFIELLKKDYKAKIQLNGNVKISYFDYNGNLAYEYEIDKSFKDKNLTFEINLTKTSIRNLLKILDKKENELLLKNCNSVEFYKKFIRIWKFNKSNKHFYEITLRYPKELKIMKLVGGGEGVKGN